MSLFNLPKHDEVTEVNLGNLQLKLVDITEQNKSEILEAVLSMYANEPCRICGKMLTREDVDEAVFAGYSKCNTSRAAHKQCWEKNTPQAQWAYPESAAQPPIDHAPKP